MLLEWLPLFFVSQECVSSGEAEDKEVDKEIRAVYVIKCIYLSNWLSK